VGGSLLTVKSIGSSLPHATAAAIAPDMGFHGRIENGGLSLLRSFYHALATQWGALKASFAGCVSLQVACF
jgi:hypothetical protein